MFRSLTAVTSPYFLVMWSSVTPAMDRFSSLPAWGGAKVSCSRGSHAGYSITPWLLGLGLGCCALAVRPWPWLLGLGLGCCALAVGPWHFGCVVRAGGRIPDQRVAGNSFLDRDLTA